jgi:hypothetical protein
LSERLRITSIEHPLGVLYREEIIIIIIPKEIGRYNGLIWLGKRTTRRLV